MLRVMPTEQQFTVHGLVKRADEALYRAKEGGRNKVDRELY